MTYTVEHHRPRLHPGCQRHPVRRRQLVPGEWQAAPVRFRGAGSSSRRVCSRATSTSRTVASAAARQTVTRNLTLQPKATGAGAAGAVHRAIPHRSTFRAPPSDTLGGPDADRAAHRRRGETRPGHRRGRPPIRHDRVHLDRHRGAAAGRGHQLPGVDKPVHGCSTTLSQGVETIRNLAQAVDQGVPTDPYDEAIAIEHHLRDPVFFQYTLNPPQDPDPTPGPSSTF